MATGSRGFVDWPVHHISYDEFYALFGMDLETRPEFLRQICYLIRNMCLAHSVVFDLCEYNELADVLLTDSEEDDRQVL